MAEFTRESIIDQEAFERPLKFANNFDPVVTAMNEVRDASKLLKKAIEDSTTTTEIKKYIEQLEKEKKALEDSIKKHKEAKDATDQHSEAIDELDNQTGGYIGRLKEMGRTLLTLAKSPFVLMLTALVATFVALTHAAKTYFAEMASGEDELDRQKAVWDQFFSTLRRGWASFGKSVVDAVGTGTLKTIMTSFIAFFSVPMAKEFEYLAGQGEKLADRLNELNDNLNENRVKAAKNQTEINELFLQAQDSVNNSEKKRLGIIDEYIRKKKEQQDLDLAIAKEQEKNTIIAIGLNRGISEAESLRLFELGLMHEEFLDEDKDRITDARVNTLNIESKHTQELRKIYKMRNGLLKDIEQSKVTDEMKIGDDRLAAQKKIIDDEIRQVQESVLATEITKEDGERRIKDIHLKYSDDIIKIEMDTIDRILKLNVLSADKQAELTKKLGDLRIEYNNAAIDQMYLDEVDGEEKKAKKQEDALEKWKQTVLKVASDISNIMGSISDSILSISDRRIESMDVELEKLEQNYERELMFVEDNVEKRTKLENEFADNSDKLQAKKSGARRRAAEFEKQVNLAQAWINMAASIVEAAPNPVLMAAMGVAGLLQIGVIASQQIPSYEKGTLSSIGKKVRVGEAGSELVIPRHGDAFLSKPYSNIIDLEPGSMVIPHEKSMQLLAYSGLSPEERSVRLQTERLGQYFQELIAVNKSNKTPKFRFNEKGELLIKSSDSSNYFMNTKYY